MTLEESFEMIVERTVRRVLREELHPELLTASEAGDVARRSAKTVLAWVRAGRLKRYGEGKPLVSRKELLELLAAPKAPAKRLVKGVPSAEEEMRRLHRRAG